MDTLRKISDLVYLKAAQIQCPSPGRKSVGHPAGQLTGSLERCELVGMNLWELIGERKEPKNATQPKLTCALGGGNPCDCALRLQKR